MKVKNEGLYEPLVESSIHNADFSAMPEEKSKEDEAFTVNWAFWVRAFRVMKMGISSPISNSVTWLLILFNFGCQIAAGIVAQNLFYYTGTGTSLSDPGMAGCLKSGTCSRETYEMYLTKFGWTFAILVAGVTVYSVTGDIINVRLRRKIGGDIQNRLFQGNTLFQIQLDGRLDNFDQRVTGDLQILLDALCCVFFGNTNDYLAYPLAFILTRMTCAFYNTFNPPNQTFVIGEDETLSIFFGVFSMMLVTLIAYFVPMNMISRLVFKSQQLEGYFRTTHTRSIVHSESIAMYNGEARERTHANDQFDKVHDNNMVYYSWQGVLMFLRVVVTIAQPSVGLILLSVTGATDNSYASAFLKQIGNVMEFMLDLPTLVARLAFSSGAAHRVGQLLEAIDVFQEHEAQDHAGEEVSYDHIKLEGVSAAPPLPEFDITTAHSFTNSVFGTCCSSDDEAPTYTNKANIFNGLNLTILPGESTVVMGPSGCGKSSLLRVIAGLWKVSEGRVERPTKAGRGGLFFLPQKSYVFPGTIIEQVLYPHALDENNSAAQIAQVVELLRLVELEHLLIEFSPSSAVDWTIILSGSERQQLSFARLFYHQPIFCLADEATCALPLELEFKLMSLCTEKNITLISVAHRPSVIPHHKKILKFDPTKLVWEHTPLPDELLRHEIPAAPEKKQGGPKRGEAVADVGENLDGFNALFFQRLWAMLRLLFPSFFSLGTLLCTVMFICAAVTGALQIIVFIEFKTDPIIAKILAGLTTEPFIDSAIIVAINVVSALLQAISAYAGAMLAVFMQRAVVRRIHSFYFDRKVVYALNNIERLEGIDQRIVSDLGGIRESLSWVFGNPFSFLNYRLGLLPLSISFIVMIAYAFYVAWALTLFFLVSLLLAMAVQSLSSQFTSRGIERRAAAEGNLRIHLGRVKLSIESITFFRGQTDELEKLTKLNEEVSVERMAYVSRATLAVLPTVVMYYWLSNGDYTMAAILQNYLPALAVDKSIIFTLVAYCYLLGKIGNQITMSAGGLGMLAGYVHRVGVLMEEAERLHALAGASTDSLEPTDTKIEMEEAAIVVGKISPEKMPIISNLSFTVNKGESMVIMGPSASGKSTINRVLAGLVHLISGKIRRPARHGGGGIFFLPQNNYVTEGSLKQQIIYPEEYSDISNGEMQAILDEVGLGYIGKRWGFKKIVDWDSVLSGGEAQRLGFARAFYQKSPFVVLDESTAALDINLEAKCMTAVRQRGLTFLSVASRLSQIPFHDRILTLDGNGGYKIAVARPPQHNPASLH